MLHILAHVIRNEYLYVLNTKTLEQMKITIRKTKGNQSSLTCADIDEVAGMIQNATYADAAMTLRTLYPVLVKDRIKNRRLGISAPDAVTAIPSLCFAGEYRNRGGEAVLGKANPLFLIEINNLAGYEEVEYLRSIAAQLPFTLMTFMGASGRSLKIVCRARCAKRDDQLTSSETLALVQSAYSKASKYYSAELGTSVDIRVPSLTSGCKISADSHLYYNADAEEFFVRDIHDVNEIPKRQQLARDDKRLMPNYDLQQTRRIQFADYLFQLFEKFIGLDGDALADHVLPLLARYCHDDGIPKEMAVALTLNHPDLNKNELYVRELFDTAYLKDISDGEPLSHVTPERLLMLRTRAFMNDRYEMRRNIVTGVAEYRIRDGRPRSFQPLTQYVMNTMTQKALMQGLKSWDKDMKRFIESKEIEEYDPINDYIESLPSWDGMERIDALAQRVPTANADWAKHFHVWFLSMVAHWMGKDSQHGNAYTPLLIGPQGCGKSSFCKLILPPAMESYYYDRIDFKNEQNADLALTRYALINIDEFDQLSPRRQALLKYLLQKSEVKTRRPYGVCIEELRRYASFIGTTNNVSPLTDPSGSRRFICVLVSDRIDSFSPVEYEQLYAQAVAEINAGARFWFDDAETVEIMHQNELFSEEDGLTTMIQTQFAPVENDGRGGEWMTLADIVAVLREHFKNLKDDIGTVQKIGRRMKSLGFYQHRGSHGVLRYLVERL
jgi:hypothetical protein